MNSPSRRERRALDRRVDRLVAPLEGTSLPDDLDLERHVGLLLRGRLVVATKDTIRRTIGPLGFSDIIDAIEAEPPGKHVGRLPVIVAVSGWLTVQFLPVTLLAQGGSC